MMRRMLFVLAVFLAAVQAATIRVPSQQPTIQAGLSAAQSGDTVLVAPGTYHERLTWSNRDGIRLLSDSGAGVTTIDADRLGRGITMTSALYTAATEVSGFTITNGLLSGSGPGAGIYCTGAPTFTRNRIVHNVIYQNSSGCGAGVYAGGSPTFIDNLIAYDSIYTVNAGGLRYGGGIWCGGSGVFCRNVFQYNAVLDTYCSGFRYGGGLYLAGGSPVVYGNVFEKNYAGAQNSSGFAYGGGVYMAGGTPVLFGNLFTGNIAAQHMGSSGFTYGGAICAWGAAPYIANNTVVRNRSVSPIPYGGGIYVHLGIAVIKNNIIALDSCSGFTYGGGIACDVDSLHPAPTYDYNDVWSNYPNNYYLCSGGVHAISSDPQFVTGAYRLSQVAAGQPSNSPCVNAGDTLTMITPLGLDSLIHAWTTRTDDVTDSGPIDLGYHYVPVPPTHDVGVARILAPTGVVESGAAVMPACSLSNYGTFAESYTIRMKVGRSFDTTVIVTGHAPGSRIYVTFPVAWNAGAPGTFSVSCSTELANDARRENDELTDSVRVVVHDVGVAEILSPADTVDPGSDVFPSARWHNYSSEAESFTARCMLERPSGSRVYSESVAVAGLPAGADTLISYAGYSVGIDTGNWTVRCSTYSVGDMVPVNDVLTGGFRVGSAQPPPPGWHEMNSLPAALSGKAVKDGAWLTEQDGIIYAAKGNKTSDFYCYNVLSDSWKMLAAIPDGREAKKPGKGAVGTTNGAGVIYATKGNGTQGFWEYRAVVDSWYQKADVPLGVSNKKVKGGTDAVFSEGFVYLLKGYKNEFWRYNTANDSWTSLPAAPLGSSGKDKYDKGTWLALVADSAHPRIYAHKAKYHELFAYDLAKDSWSSDVLNGLPFIGMMGKSKKSKDGGSAALLDGYIYALKGGNTQEFWRYSPAADSWKELDTMPAMGSTGKKKKVKAGGDITTSGDFLYALKGNKTLEFWRYVPWAAQAQAKAKTGIMAQGKLAVPSLQLAVSQNPLRSGFVTLHLNPRLLGSSNSTMLTVSDISGRVLQSRTCNRQSTIVFDLRHLPAGVCFVRLSSGSRTSTQKLTISH